MILLEPYSTSNTYSIHYTPAVPLLIPLSRIFDACLQSFVKKWEKNLLKRKWIGPIDKSGTFYSDYKGLKQHVLLKYGF